MLVSILFFLSISSVSAMMAYKWNLNYEYGLPISISGIVLIQFVFGLFGALSAGFWTVAVVSVILWIYVIYKGCRGKEWERLSRSFFSRGFFLFLVSYLMLNFTLNGMVIYASDEFSHWGRVVKAMVWLDDLGTNPNSELTFFSYPPGVALFQYYLQKIYSFCTGKFFSEWHLYLGHSTLGLAFVIPLIERVSQVWKGRKRSFFLLAVIFLLLPVIFYPNYYYLLEVDGMLGIMAGCGLCWVILYKEKYDFAYLFSVIAILTLVKSTGFVFAFGICIVLVLVEIWEKGRRGFWDKVILILLPVVLKTVWQIKVNLADREPPLPQKIDIAAFFNVLEGKDTSYRNVVWENFKKVLFDRQLASFDFHIIGRTVSVSYMWVLMLSLFFSFLFLCRLKKKDRMLYGKALGVVITGYVMLVFFDIGLLFTYLFKFTEVQSITLHSYARYNNTIYLLIYMTVFCVGVLAYDESTKKQNFLLVIITGMFIVVFPWQSFRAFLLREVVSEKLEWRETFKELAVVITEEVSIDERTYFICQDDRSWYNSNSDIQVAFQIYPRKIQYGSSYFTAQEPGVDTGWFYNNMSIDEFREELIQGYDYVAIHRKDEYFIEQFGELFEDKESIEDDCLYKVDTMTGLLRRVE